MAILGARVSLGFPEVFLPHYLEETKALKMWRPVPVKDYPAEKVKRLVEDGEKKREAFYSHGLRSLETLSKPNT